MQLSERRTDLVSTYSGGKARRLEIARGMLHTPDVLFLDEPTVGLDPQTRALMWEDVLRLRREEGVTVFLTTHHMDEAEYADRTAIIDRGTGVKTLAVGDRVLVSCISACGRCRFCREGRYGQCLGGGGWILGHLIDGTQAELVRVPFADTSTHPVPDGATDEEVLMLADILPTSYEVGVLNGRVQPGDTVAIVGAGPIGLAAIVGARLFSPGRVISIDLVDTRLEAAKQFGADVTVNNGQEDAVAAVRELTGGLGADVVIEAVGVPQTFELCTELVRPGGHVANIGVHGRPATLHLESLWTRDLTITTGLVDTYSTPTLLRLVASRQVDAGRFASHHFEIDQMLEAYDVFERASDTGALKVVLTR